ncbi:MAG: PD-(D/E)XK nuclease family protein [Alistipes sp.]|nr:PD-(D/E)XK nuclease family protein [Alistipes sp.]
MQGFLAEVASQLYRRYGDAITDRQIVFPNRRAQLFFCEALCEQLHRPLWQPAFPSIGELMERIAGVRTSDRIKLITELYKVYSEFHTENFDSFYFWGEMLLSDFDQIDKYQIEADKLFANVLDLKELEQDLSYLTPEQVEIILRFWRNFGIGENFSEEQRHFLKIGNSLSAIYRRYRERLTAQGLAYEGMVYRLAADRLKQLDTEAWCTPDDRFLFIGFNALSACEKELFSALQRSGQAEFFWDYDDYYVTPRDYEAGLFLRDNLRAYPPSDLTPIGHDHFRKPKEIHVIPTPSDTLQCKYVHHFLQTLLDQGEHPDKETAIVLTDESLLLPVLYSIPAALPALNITMGYPLRQTTAYSFVERLIALQHHARIRHSRTEFYHSDVTGLLNHPYIQEHQASQAETLLQQIRQRQMIYIAQEAFPQEGLLHEIFTPTDSWQSLCRYLTHALSEVIAHSADLEPSEQAQRREFFTIIVEHLTRIENALSDAGVEVSVSIFTSLLRRTLQTLRIPYEGEPLAGVQIMGILETRNLDFRNVVVLSMNDDSFPGSRTLSNSFIPYNLRYAYGLPTPQHHEGVYAYYFYRLLQRAERVHLVYCSRSDDKRTGEQSRYITQLEMESSHTLHRHPIQLGVNLSDSAPICIKKDDTILHQLHAFLHGGDRTLSPTAFYHYIECPLKFYFRSLAGLAPVEEVSEEIDMPLFGTILHRALELLYTPLIGRPHPQKHLQGLIGSPAIEQAVRQAINENYLHTPEGVDPTYGGNLILVKDVVCKYINRCVLPYDVAQTETFVVQGLEQRVECEVAFPLGSETLSARFAGKSDRIDLLPHGTWRVVDYKSGSPHGNSNAATVAFHSLEELFGTEIRTRSAAALQTLLYALMICESEHCEVQPTLYYVRNMQSAHFSPLLHEGNEPIVQFTPYRAAFLRHLQTTLSQLFDPQIPFTQCDDPATCTYCDFKEICRR